MDPNKLNVCRDRLLAARPEAGLVALTHALALRLFYDRGIGYDTGSCLRLKPQTARGQLYKMAVAKSRLAQAAMASPRSRSPSSDA
jgi:hypothetical protein